MRNRFLALLFLGFSLSSFCARAQQNDEQKKVNAAIIGLFDGLATLDEQLMRRHVTADFLLLEDGAIWTIDTLINKVSPLKKVAFSRVNHLDFIRTDVSGNTAWVAYHNRADVVVNGQKRNRQWLESASLVKQGNDWKITLLHSTVVKPKSN
ncbi:nuclear transport factor 2 family protein [Spirosoma luteum]|uniref:nuclear transport factor 2 family protein n=1 Tax=Spirosoma luteum TaxID=431553 RepID=UPI000369BEA2|nr:nuclear transport factor 2 family protein [Spirosoma luteum]